MPEGASLQISFNPSSPLPDRKKTLWSAESLSAKRSRARHHQKDRTVKAESIGGVDALFRSVPLLVAAPMPCDKVDVA